jgi:hypothetical protein
MRAFMPSLLFRSRIIHLHHGIPQEEYRCSFKDTKAITTTSRLHVIPFASGYRQGFDIAVVSSKSAFGMLCLPGCSHHFDLCDFIIVEV